MLRTFYILGIVLALLVGPTAAMAAEQCREVTATNRQHVNAGRAHHVTGLGCDTPGYYAVGSEEYLGSTASTQATLFTTDGGQSYHLGPCPASGGDQDGDGYEADVDCNDADAAIHPQAAEICGDGIDQDCDGSDLQCAGCQQWTATNDAHVAAKRAYSVSGSSGCNRTVAYFAVGSGDALGTSGSAVTTLYSQDGGKTYKLGNCPAPAEDIDGDGIASDRDCDDHDPYIHPGAMDFCGDGIDQDCSGADAPCLPPPSCIPSLENWKVKFAPRNSDCKSCHTTCTFGGLDGVHNCIEGGDWGALNCRTCHGNVHR